MPSTRVLAMVELRVSAKERAAFLEEHSARRLAATAVGAHVWMFEHLDEPNRFIEFTEAATASDVASVHGGELPAPLWRAVQGV